MPTVKTSVVTYLVICEYGKNQTRAFLQLFFTERTRDEFSEKKMFLGREWFASMDYLNDKSLLKEAKREIFKRQNNPRPRRKLYIGRHNGRKCYMTNKSKAYWEMVADLKKPIEIKIPRKYKHIFAPKHFMYMKSILELFFDFIYNLFGWS